MKLKIIPIAMTMVDWETFIKVCSQELNYSPSKSLDASSIYLNDPASYLASLGFSDDPKQVLDNAKDLGILDHMSMSFLVITDSEKPINTICRFSNLVAVKKVFHDDYLFVLSGSLNDFYNAIMRGCRDRDSEALVLQIYTYLKMSGFRRIFSNIQEVQDAKGNFRINTT